jgi:hypothetical protein
MTQFGMVIMIAWGVLVVITATLYLYRGRLQRDEEDQIFLDDAFSQEKVAQEAIAAKVNSVQPLLRVFIWILAVVTVFVIGYWIWDIVAQFK